MIKNYFVIALRNIKKYFSYSFINIFGLVLGTASCLLILQYVLYETSYDDFHENADNIYRLVLVTYEEGQKVTTLGATPCPMGPALKAEYPEVVDFARLFERWLGVISHKNKQFIDERGFCADSSFLTMFSFPFLKGDPATALDHPNTAVISETLAKKLFGEEDPMGKIIKYDRIDSELFMVTGVFKDIPGNSHDTFDFLFSIQHIVNHEYYKNNWGATNFYQYVLLRPGTDAKSLEKKLPGFIDRYFDGDKLRKENKRKVCLLQPLRDIYLHSGNMNWETEKRGDPKSLYFLTIVAIFILVIAWVNHLNLSMARAGDRAKEVGLRKVVGAKRSELMKQFLFESFLINIFAAVIAVIIVYILNPYFNRLLGISLSIGTLAKSYSWLILSAIFLLGVLLAAIYPAFVLSSFKPITGLRGKFSRSGGGQRLRKVLIMVQLIVSIALIAGTLTVYKQIDFMRNQDLGMNLDNVLIMHGVWARKDIPNFEQKIKDFITVLSEYPAISSASKANVPGKEYQVLYTLERKKEDGSKIIRTIKGSWVDYRFFDTYRIKVIAGKNFAADIDSSNGLLIDENAVKVFEFESPEKALNQFLYEISGDPVQIIGVTSSYNQRSLKYPREPVAFLLPSYTGSHYYSVRIGNMENFSETLNYIKKTFDQMFPGNPFGYLWMDDFFNRQYDTDRNYMKVFGLFALLAIIIASVGLFALFSYITAQRKKEIGIRKVFGADVPNILFLLSKDFIKLIAYAIVIALPMSYFVFNKWLEKYAFRVGIGLWFFLVPILVIIPIALLTIAYQVVKAAQGNPVDALRYE